MKHNNITSDCAVPVIDKVEEASLESFPASDAPAWICVESQTTITQNQEAAAGDPAYEEAVTTKKITVGPGDTTG